MTKAIYSGAEENDDRMRRKTGFQIYKSCLYEKRCQRQKRVTEKGGEEQNTRQILKAW